jgi:hypothetical protein
MVVWQVILSGNLVCMLHFVGLLLMCQASSLVKHMLCCVVLQIRDHTTPPYALRADLKKLALSKEVFGTK